MLLLDIPWSKTGLTLGYPTIEDQEWMDALDFDELLDDGLVFMWVVNSSLEVTTDFMRFVRKEIITWVKLQRDGQLLERGGYHLSHSFEMCL